MFLIAFGVEMVAADHRILRWSSPVNSRKLHKCTWNRIVFNSLVWYFKIWEKNNYKNKWIIRTRTLAWILYNNKEKKNNFLDKKSSTGTLASLCHCSCTEYIKKKLVILNCLTCGTCITDTGNMYKTVEIKKQFKTAPTYRVITTQSY